MTKISFKRAAFMLSALFASSGIVDRPALQAAETPSIVVTTMDDTKVDVANGIAVSATQDEFMQSVISGAKLAAENGPARQPALSVKPHDNTKDNYGGPVKPGRPVTVEIAKNRATFHDNIKWHF